MMFPMMMVNTTLSSPYCLVTESQIRPIPTLPMKLPTPILENSQLASRGSMPLDIACSWHEDLSMRTMYYFKDLLK